VRAAVDAVVPERASKHQPGRTGFDDKHVRVKRIFNA
jgi:hypothetical protein